MTKARTPFAVPAVSPRPQTVLMKIVVDLPDAYDDPQWIQKGVLKSGKKGTAHDGEVGESVTRESLASDALASMESAREEGRRAATQHLPRKKRRTREEMKAFRAELRAKREERREEAVPQWLLDADKAEEADVQGILNGDTA